MALPVGVWELPWLHSRRWSRRRCTQAVAYGVQQQPGHGLDVHLGGAPARWGQVLPMI